MNKKGQLLSESKLRKLFKKKIDFERTNEIICSCGSGITACNILFLLNFIGFKNLNYMMVHGLNGEKIRY